MHFDQNVNTLKEIQKYGGGGGGGGDEVSTYRVRRQPDQ